MIQRIKTWFANYLRERKRRKILKIIKKAKLAYLNHESLYMCCCFYDVAPYMFYKDIVEVIPEYKPSTFGLDREKIRGPWWPVADKE